jgi:hypothetical protein
MAAGKMFLNGELNLREWMASLRDVKQFTYFSRGDLLPFMMHCTTMISQMLKPKRGSAKRTPKENTSREKIMTS